MYEENKDRSRRNRQPNRARRETRQVLKAYENLQDTTKENLRRRRSERRKERSKPTVTSYEVATRETTPITARPRDTFRYVATLLVVVAALILALIVAGKAFDRPDASSGDASAAGAGDSGAATAATTNATADPRYVKVTFAGDCTLGTDENFDYSTSFNSAFKSKGDPSWFLRNVADIFNEDDITVVNMEGTLTRSNSRVDKTFAFKGDADFAKVFSSSSVEAASMANNHSKDYGAQSYEDTLDALRAENIKPFGYDNIAYIDKNGVKVALIGLYELAEHEGIKDSMIANIERAKREGAELVLVYAHWGNEREYQPNSTQVMLGRAAIDAGADLVIGSHPHVVQSYEVYQGRYIVYSLGNFCFGGNSNPSDKDCLVFQQSFTLNGDGVAKNDDVNFIACSISSTSSYNNYQPTPATGAERDHILAKVKDISGT